MSNPKKAFTLVELIVVIVILAILATIAFLSFSSQSASARDSTRLSDMSNIAKGLSVFNAVSGKLPMPDSYITITASGTSVGYQGKAGNNTLNMIKISNGGKDPLDINTYYTYSTNASQSKFQILGFLEDGSNSALSYMPRSFAADYSKRFSITKGDNIGILLSSGTLDPAENKLTTSFTGIDLIKTTDEYVARLSNKENITGSGVSLGRLSSYMKTYKSCKDISDSLSLSGSVGRDGIYNVNPDGKMNIQAYCDMTTSGGGWTQISNLNQFDLTQESINDVGYGYDKTKFSDSLINYLGTNKQLMIKNKPYTVYSIVSWNGVFTTGNFMSCSSQNNGKTYSSSGSFLRDIVPVWCGSDHHQWAWTSDIATVAYVVEYSCHHANCSNAAVHNGTNWGGDMATYSQVGVSGKGTVWYTR